MKITKVGLVAVQIGVQIGLPVVAAAQVPGTVMVQPGYGTTQNGNASGTVTTTTAFQKVFSATGYPASSGALRRGCVIQNNSTHTMYVSEGTTTGSATTSASFQLTTTPPGNLYFCNMNGLVTFQGEVDLRGTAADLFYAAQW